MEGVGSRLGRASARYGPAPVFNGPVRKWKKQWVHVSTLSYHSSRFNNGNNNTNASALLLCRWTPISSTNSGDSDTNSAKLEDPPRRKFRYSPIVVLEEKKKEGAKKVDAESVAIKSNQSTARETSESNAIFGHPSIDNLFTEETKASNRNQLVPKGSNISPTDVDLCFRGDDDKHISDDENEEAELGEAGEMAFEP